eukprot:GHVS01080864.1.p1 GENE.GHVS01080864.1~~GHVS01080864.1.p1  ORF type:complete len:605 (-),score=133.20 GHVS01080864.1:372-2186(-)
MEVTCLAANVGVEAVPSEPSSSPRFYGIRSCHSRRRAVRRVHTFPKSNDEAIFCMSKETTTTATTTTSGTTTTSATTSTSGTTTTSATTSTSGTTSSKATTTVEVSSVSAALKTEENEKPSESSGEQMYCRESDGQLEGRVEGGEAVVVGVVGLTKDRKDQVKEDESICLGGLKGHRCKELDLTKTVWQVLDPFGCQQCLDDIKLSARQTTVHIGLWSDQSITCGMPLPTGLSFIDEFVAKKFTPMQLVDVRDRYLTELKARLPVWLNTLETDQGWKYHGTKNGNVFHRREPKGEPPIIRGRMNMGSSLSLQEYNDINMDRDFYPNLYEDNNSLKHFKPAVTWAGSLEQPWFLNLSWLCYNGFPPIVSDRELLTASLVVFLDKHTTVTVSMSVDDFTIDFPEKPKNAVPVNLAAIFRIRQLEDKTVEHCGVVQASMKLLVPQFIFIRSSLFTQPVDWPTVMNYAQSKRGRCAIGRHPVCCLIKQVADGIDGREMWVEGRVSRKQLTNKRVCYLEEQTRCTKSGEEEDSCGSISSGGGGVVVGGGEGRGGGPNDDAGHKEEQEAFDPWKELLCVTAETLCEYAWKRNTDVGGGSGAGCGGGEGGQ